MATTKKQRDEIVAVIEEYLVEHADRVAQLLEEGRVRAVNDGPEPEPQPDRRPRVVALKSFVHRGNEVPIGSVWLKSHDVVASAPRAFADVIEH